VHVFFHHLTVQRFIAGVIALILSAAAWLAFRSSQRVPEVTFTLLSGQKISTAQLAGKVYLVHFWATSCSTCMREMPQMVEIYEAFKNRGMEFIAVAMAYDSPVYVKNYTLEARLPFKVAIDDGSAARQFGNVQLTPTTFVINKDGRIVKRYVGIAEFSALHQALQRVL
jgi:peroxiredoxin